MNLKKLYKLFSSPRMIGAGIHGMAHRRFVSGAADAAAFVEPETA
jgi:hypothetical protein